MYNETECEVYPHNSAAIMAAEEFVALAGVDCIKMYGSVAHEVVTSSRNFGVEVDGLLRVFIVWGDLPRRAVATATIAQLSDGQYCLTRQALKYADKSLDARPADAKQPTEPVAGPKFFGLGQTLAQLCGDEASEDKTEAWVAGFDAGVAALVERLKTRATAGNSVCRIVFTTVAQADAVNSALASPGLEGSVEIEWSTPILTLTWGKPRQYVWSAGTANLYVTDEWKISDHEDRQAPNSQSTAKLS